MSKFRKARAIAKSCGITFCRGDLPRIIRPPGYAIIWSDHGEILGITGYQQVASTAALRKSKQRKGRGR